MSNKSYSLEYSEVNGFYFSENNGHHPNKNRKLLSKSISYYRLRKFTDLMRAEYPSIWNNEFPKFKTIEKHFKKYDNPTNNSN